MSQTMIAGLVEKSQNKVLAQTFAVGGSIVFLALLAQVVIPLPWTPVPITGQTFAVALVALLTGRKNALFAVGGYLGLGALGAPVFAGQTSGILPGPTLGYLVGMLLASQVVGALADRGWARTWWKAFLACYLGSVCVFGCGLLVLSYFVPANALLAAGVLPFMIGDLIKNISAATLAVTLCGSPYKN